MAIDSRNIFDLFSLPFQRFHDIKENISDLGLLLS